MMYNIAIIEDNAAYAKRLHNYLLRYGQEKPCEFRVEIFSNGIDFLTDYKAKYDIVFMDIDLPHMNGMDCAVKLRAVDKRVPLVFVTNLIQYSVKGYEVDAVAYLVKPVEYFSFRLAVDKIIKQKLSDGADTSVLIKNGDTVRRVAAKDILYVEVMNHYLTYHTTEGDFRTLGKMKEAEAALKDESFFRCHNCFLVNLRFVKGFQDGEVRVGNDLLSVSRQKKKDFLLALNEYFKKGGK